MANEKFAATVAKGWCLRTSGGTWKDVAGRAVAAAVGKGADDLILDDPMSHEWTFEKVV
jgi:hypothetical protein